MLLYFGTSGQSQDLPETIDSPPKTNELVHVIVHVCRVTW